MVILRQAILVLAWEGDTMLEGAILEEAILKKTRTGAFAIKTADGVGIALMASISESDRVAIPIREGAIGAV
jgi:hypothetical protein